MIPAPLGLPADNFPSCAKSLPISFGNHLFNFDSVTHVTIKANNIPIKATIG